jgi:hypothetical protein
MQDVDIEEKVDVIISEWMGYMLLYEVYISISIVCTVGLILFSLHISAILEIGAEYAGKCNFC